MMNHLFKNKRKKSPEPSPQGISPGTSTDVAAGLVSHQEGSYIGPEGEQSSYQDLEVDWPDLTMALDEGSGGGSQILSQDRMDIDQELPALGGVTSGAAISGTGHRNNPTSECVLIPTIATDVHADVRSSPHQMRTPAILEGE